MRDALPNASFIGFTGTPISLEDKDTQDVFGRYVSIYDLQDAVEDDATVPIVYEARQIRLNEKEHDELFKEIDDLLEEEQSPALRLQEKLLGSQARLADLAADFVQHFAKRNEVVDSRFTPWKVVDEKNKSARLYFDDELQSLLSGLMKPEDLLDYIRYFVLFERDSTGKTIKKIAAYHQYYGVNEAVDSTIWATSEKGDRRIGVMWHTQGSGKSISMLFYAGKLLAQPELKNPTIVVVTDRNDLDGQLFQTFSSGKDLIKQTPQQVEDREQLRQLLAQNEVGGVFFTTIQKFALNEEESRFPVLNERSNIIVISDEAHRSQYGFTQKLHNGKFQAGYARHLRDALPNASFIGFTGTPISLEDKDTQDVFGRYVSIYDLQDAVEDGATVPIVYEARQIRLNEKEHDELFKEIDELLEEERSPALRLQEKLLGSQARLADLASDFVQHFAKRNEVVDSKAMMVVSSRQICVDLYNEIIKLRPEWHSDNINEGTIKIVMTGSLPMRRKCRNTFTVNKKNKRWNAALKTQTIR